MHKGFTPYIKKGIQYYCVNCKPLCENRVKNFNNRIIDSTISSTIEKLILTEDELLQIEESTDYAFTGIGTKRTEHLAEYRQAKKKDKRGYYLFTAKQIESSKNRCIYAGKLPGIRTGVE